MPPPARELTAHVLLVSLHYAPEPTGNAPYSSGLARGLRKRGVAVRAITGHPHYPEWAFAEGYGQWTRRENVYGVPVTRLWHYLPAKPQGVRRLLSELSFGLRAATARWGRPDTIVLVSPAMFSTAIAMLRARLMPSRPRVIVWVQDIYGLGITETGSGGALVSTVMNRIESLMLQAATTVVVIHDRFGRHLIEKLGVDPTRVEVVRNWTHTSATSDIDVPAVRKRHGWAADDTVVLHAGNMGGKQGLENVVDAARIAAQQSLPIRFVLLGDGNRRAALEEYARGVPTLQFIDPLNDDEFVAALHSADVLLVNEKPGVSEMSVPSKLTSYFNTGRPVVAASEPHGVTAEEIGAAQAGFTVRSGHPQHLVDACMSLRADPELAKRLGRNGQEYRHRVLGEDAAIDRFCGLIARSTVTPKYNEELSSRHPGGS